MAKAGNSNKIAAFQSGEQGMKRVVAAAAAMLLDLQPATFRHHLGYTTTLPLGVDALGMRRVFDTDSLAAAFPFDSADPAVASPGHPVSTDGVLYGVNTTSRGVLLWNVWEQVPAARKLIAEPGPFRAENLKGRLPA